MFKTPKYKANFDVYEPAEDTFLLLDSLEKDAEFLTNLDPFMILEIGSGSGIVISFLSLILPYRLLFATDINRNACQSTIETSILNQTNVHVINTQFMNSLRVQPEVIIFNPPYVPSTQQELGQDDIKASWAGGIDGRQVIDSLISNLESFKGVLYLVLVNENKPKEICDMMAQKGFKSTLIMYRVSGWEGLSVYRFQKQL
jgi:release factor glutamine methyltransferase